MGDLDEKVTEAVEHSAESRLNSVVAILVAFAATFMALGNVKDGNIGQAMAQAQAKAGWLLGLAALFLATGVLFEVAGFLGWPLHPDRLMSWLS